MSKETFNVPVNIDAGQGLLYFAGMYPTLLAKVLEVIQNGIDAGGTTRITVLIDRKNKRIEVRDNGKGMSREFFSERMSMVARSSKTTQEDKYGQFGIGMFALYDMCEEFSITTSPKGQSDYIQYGFPAKAMRQRKIVNSGFTGEVADLVFDKKAHDHIQYEPKGRVWWQTRFVAEGYDADGTLNDFSMVELQRMIRTKFDQAFNKGELKILITLIDKDGKSVNATVNQGRQLGEALTVKQVHRIDVGTVTFRLHLQPRSKAGTKQKVLIGSTRNVTRIIPGSFLRIVKKTKEYNQNEDIMGAMKLYEIFCGEITGDNLFIDPNRRNVKQDKYLHAFIMAHATWYRDGGKELIESRSEASREKKWHALAKESLGVVQNILESRSMGTMLNKLSSEGEDGAQQTKIHLPQSGGNVRFTPLKGSQRQRKKAKSGSISRIQGGGGRRKLKTKPKGIEGVVLRFEFAELNTTDPYAFDDGVLIFNIRHDEWGRCMKSDHDLKRWMTMLAMEALVMEDMREVDVYSAKKFTTKFHPLLAELMREFGPGRKKTNR